MNWIKDIIKKHVGEDGKFDLEAAAEEIKSEAPKNIVPKDQYNNVAEQLKTANATLTTLQKENKDVEALQTQINDYKQKAESAQNELAETVKTSAIKDALRDAGAQDIDYMMFKLGDVEVDKDGSIKDLDSKIKALKEGSPSFFETVNTEDNISDNGQGGYKPLDTKLGGNGGAPDPEGDATAAFEAAVGIQK